MLKKINQRKMEGFTLIELLIVMAVLGVLAVVVLIAINPAEQLRRARDSGKISGVQQLGRAATGYYVAQSAYPTADATWISQMVTTGDLATVPADPIGSSGDPACAATGVENGWCYEVSVGADNAVIFQALAAAQYNEACGVGGQAYAVFSTVDARGGWGCAVPVAGTSYAANFQ